MSKLWRLPVKSPVQLDMLWGRDEPFLWKIISTAVACCVRHSLGDTSHCSSYDVRNLHEVIINNIRQVVCRIPVPLDDDEVLFGIGLLVSVVY